MAAHSHSSILAWRIPWTEEPGGLPSRGLQRVGHGWALSTNALQCFLIGVSVQFRSVTRSCPTLCNPMDFSTPGLPVHHQLPEFTQTHVHWVCDSIQPSYPLLSPSPLAFNLSQNQGLFKCVSSLHQVAKVLELQLQLFWGIFRVDFI